MNSIDVSIVIVCMNNLKNLYPCLESIRKYTNKVAYETLVVAYLFSKDNLVKVKADFPWVKFIESNEIRGFSENNNIALRQAKGKYCFVLNDDTEMRMPVIDRLVNTIETLPDYVAIVSPVTTFPDGRVQVCGRPYQDWKTICKSCLGIRNKYEKLHCNKEGVFESYNIVGAAFLIKTDLFRQAGWFDERFFFCPEDIALSDGLNKSGYKCYVDSDVRIIHYEGMSGKSASMIQTATRPTHAKGSVIFYSQENKYLYVFLMLFFFIIFLLRHVFHKAKYIFNHSVEDKILAIGDMNSCKSVLTNKSPKEIFIKYYSEINK